MSKEDEVAVIGAIARELDGLADDSARARVLAWALNAYGDGLQAAASITSQRPPDPPHAEDVGDLIERAMPEGTQDRVLVVAYWFQELQGAEGFDSKSVNDILKDMGHPVANITKELGRLMAKTPQLVRQTEKSGRSQQARKRYRLTEAGRRRVQEMITARST